MLTSRKHLAVLVGLCVGAFASPSLAQTRSDHSFSSPASERLEQITANRAAALRDCNRAGTEHNWYEDVNAFDAYRACMAAHGQVE